MVLTILKNMKVNGKDDIPYMKWKIKFMFETTNQLKIMEYNGYIYIQYMIEGSLEVKLPTIWTDEK